VKGSLAGRLSIAAAIVVLTYGAMHVLNAGIKPAEVVFPAWVDTIFDKDKGLPMQLGPWTGQKCNLDPVIFAATGAKFTEDRIYTDDIGHSVSMHIAIFDNPDDGLIHTPFNCYRTQGFQSRKEKLEPLPGEQKPAPQVFFTQWDQDGLNPCLVVHWYQLGDTMIYDRFDLGTARFAMRTWPPLIKVLIQINGTTDDDKELIMSYSKLVYAWLNQPSHKAETLTITGPNTTAPANSEKSAKPNLPAKAEKTK
jgi:hypothetical protein